jgi:hypothetical protein
MSALFLLDDREGGMEWEDRLIGGEGEMDGEEMMAAAQTIVRCRNRNRRRVSK